MKQYSFLQESVGPMDQPCNKLHIGDKVKLRPGLRTVPDLKDAVGEIVKIKDLGDNRFAVTVHFRLDSKYSEDSIFRTCSVDGKYRRLVTLNDASWIKVS